MVSTEKSTLYSNQVPEKLYIGQWPYPKNNIQSMQFDCSNWTHAYIYLYYSFGSDRPL
jgi:hypothetical protein